MKCIFTFSIILLSIGSFASPNKTFDRLCEVNKYWQEQNDISRLQYPVYTDKNDREWIRTHLTLVEQVLRSRSTNHLSAAQKANRMEALNHLNEYWHSGSFPINDKYSYKTPIFIDQYDNFCAVGYLVKVTGHEDVSRMIAAKTNLAYVKDMNYPELFAWANEYGFTVDELAWIQPQYPWSQEAREMPIGGGTDGVIYKLFNDGYQVIAAGNFSTVDGNIPANNIAMFREYNGVFSWDTVSTGVDGTVYALESYKGNLIIGGDFTLPGGTGSNIGIWDWWYEIRGMGCIYGTVNDLFEHSGELYAVGDFDVCAALAEVNFAKWDDSNQVWLQIPGLEGHVNTITAISGTFYLGGAFTYQNDTMNIIKWTEKGGFEKFDKPIEKEVTDITYYNNHIYASAKATSYNEQDSLLYTLKGEVWMHADFSFFAADTLNNIPPSYNVLEVDNNIMYVGGSFLSATGQDILYNSFSIDGLKIPDVNTDGAIYDIVTYRGKVYFGGAFKNDNKGQYQLNSICTRNIENVSVSALPKSDSKLIIYPNPANRTITVENNFNATKLNIYSIEGKLVLNQAISSNKESIALPELSTGTYIAELVNAEGMKATERLVIE